MPWKNRAEKGTFLIRGRVLAYSKQGWAAPAPELSRLLGAGPFWRWSWSRTAPFGARAGAGAGVGQSILSSEPELIPERTIIVGSESAPVFSRSVYIMRLSGVNAR